MFIWYNLWHCAKLKNLLMSLVTLYHRLKLKGKKTPQLKENVERVRRAQRNDLENIPAFIVIAFIYQLTFPSVFLAKHLIRFFSIARIMHTIVYAIVPIKQPARILAFNIGMLINVYMVYKSVKYFFANK